jgi:hypothetical protein
LLIPLALGGVWWVERILRQSGLAKTELSLALRWRLVTGWLAVTIILIILPVNFSRRFLEGIHLPLCCLATAGYYQLLPVGRKYRLKEKALTLVLSLSSLLMVALSIALLYLPQDNLLDPIRSPYLSQGETGAIEWLRQNSQPGEVILTGPVLGNVIPGRALRPVFYGHAMETLDPDRKLQLLMEFFDAATSPPVRAQIIQAGQINYLVYGWRERRLGGFNPASAGWPLVFSQDGVEIYRLN